MTKEYNDLEELHSTSFHNAELIMAKYSLDYMVVCFHCVKRYASRLVAETVDAGQTALCPKCGIDSVIEDTERDKVIAMQDKYFNFGTNSKTGVEARVCESPFEAGDWE
jgi:hypothetical protein